jgi:hypothetical protein
MKRDVEESRSGMEIAESRVKKVSLRDVRIQEECLRLIKNGDLRAFISQNPVDFRTLREIKVALGACRQKIGFNEFVTNEERKESLEVYLLRVFTLIKAELGVNTDAFDYYQGVREDLNRFISGELPLLTVVEKPLKES